MTVQHTIEYCAERLREVSRKYEEQEGDHYTGAALAGETVIFDIIEAEHITNPKKLKKFAQRLMQVTTSEVQLRLLQDIMIDRDPVKYVRDCAAKIRDCAVVIRQFVEDGCHGMIMINNTVYPVQLKTQEKWLKEDKLWDPTDEMEIQHHAANDWMRQHDKGYFLGKVVLFPQFGFSGIPRIVEMQCTKEVDGLTRYPGTNFFYDKKGA
jgi:hypothetical protein